MALGDIRDLVVTIARLDARLRLLEQTVLDLNDRVDVIETNSISYENRLQDLEEQDDDNDN